MAAVSAVMAGMGFSAFGGGGTMDAHSRTLSDFRNDSGRWDALAKRESSTATVKEGEHANPREDRDRDRDRDRPDRDRDRAKGGLAGGLRSVRKKNPTSSAGVNFQAVLSRRLHDLEGSLLREVRLLEEVVRAELRAEFDKETCDETPMAPEVQGLFWSDGQELASPTRSVASGASGPHVVRPPWAPPPRQSAKESEVSFAPVEILASFDQGGQFASHPHDHRPMIEVEDRDELESTAPNLNTPKVSRSGSRIGGTSVADQKHKKMSEVLQLSEAQPQQAKKRQRTQSRIVEEWSKLTPFNVIMESVFGLLILANAITIGVQADVSQDWSGWLILDGAFATMFTAECVIKLQRGCRDYFMGIDRFWNYFEFTLVIQGIVELILAVSIPDGGGTSGLSLLRILRLARISRLLRICRLQMFTELKIMISGAIGGCRTLGWASILLCLPLYSAAIAFRETLGIHAGEGFGAEAFETVPTAFFTLFRCTVSSECADHYGRPIWALVASRYGWIYSFMYCMLEVLMTFGLFNVVVAIFIENVLAGARTDNLVMQRERLRDKSFFANKMSDLLAIILEVVHGAEPGMGDQWDTSSSEVLQMEITPDVMDAVMNRPGVHEIFRDLALAEEDMVSLFETLDADGSGTIDMAELFDGIQKLRGAPRRSDVVGLNIMMQQLWQEMCDQRETLESLIPAGHTSMLTASVNESEMMGNMSAGISLSQASPNPSVAALALAKPPNGPVEVSQV